MDKYTELAKLADKAERYEDMMKYMTTVATNTTTELTNEERRLLTLAYKKVVGNLRYAWLVTSSFEQKENNMERRVLIKKHKYNVLKTELSTVCATMLNLVDSHLLPYASTTESKVYYLKIKGDYHRYFAEVLEGDDRKKAADDCMLAYNTAMDMASAQLSPSHPTRLALLLNVSVFYFEVLESVDKARTMTREVMESALVEYDRFDDPRIGNETKQILEILKSNYILWGSEEASFYETPNFS